MFALGNLVLSNVANVQADTTFIGNIAANNIQATNKIETESFIRVGPAYDQGETWANPGGLFFGNTVGSIAKYYQINLQNVDPEGSGDLVVTADNGNDASNFITMGINGSNYSSLNYPSSFALDGYLWIEGGNLVVASNTHSTFIGAGNNAVHGISITRSGNVELYGNANLKYSDGTIQTTAYNASAISANIGVIYNLFALGNVEFGNVNANIAAANVQILSLQSNVAAANVQILSLQSNVAAANVEILSLQSNVAAANVQILSLQSNVAAANIILAQMPYTMANYQHWTSNVSNVSAALDQLASRIWAIENP